MVCIDSLPSVVVGCQPVAVGCANTLCLNA